MKFYTKEWYELMQRLDYCLGMKPVEDKDYSDEDIRRLYERALKKYVGDAEREYNEPPQFIELDPDALELDEFVFFDGQNGKLEKPKSIYEIKQHYEEERRREFELFESRPPFARDECIADFREMYEARQKHEFERYPEWVRGSVDPRLAALGYLPRSVFDKLKAESKSNKREFDRINRAARKALEAEKAKLSERVTAEFGFHDAELMELSQSGSDLTMLLRRDCACFEGETPYTRVTFRNAAIVQADEKAFSQKDGGYDCAWLYDELYAADCGIEAHMLFYDYKDGGLAYLTVRCSDIVIESNVDYRI